MHNLSLAVLPGAMALFLGQVAMLAHVALSSLAALVSYNAMQDEAPPIGGFSAVNSDPHAQNAPTTVEELPSIRNVSFVSGHDCYMLPSANTCRSYGSSSSGML
eukprot:3422490-Amphidinium_carterae.1